MIEFTQLSGAEKAAMPNLFLIGAAKSGTTSLHSYLSRHPLIAGSAQKEPNFFVDQEQLAKHLLLESMRPESKELGSYLSLFPAHGPERFRLEASPTYSNHPMFTGVAERIARAAPMARILYLVRNPVDRAISHYWMDRRQLIEGRPMQEAVTLDSHYVAFGDYTLQLAQYDPFFQDILIVASERLRKTPEAVLNEIFVALGLGTIAMEPESLAEKNITAQTTLHPRFPMVRTFRDTRIWNLIRNRLSRRQLDAVRRVAVKKVAREDAAEANVRAMLVDYFLPKVQQFDCDRGQNLASLWFGGRGG